jgi:hypothetical protein
MRISGNAVVNTFLIIASVFTCFDIGYKYFQKARTDSGLGSFSGDLGIGKYSKLTGPSWSRSKATVVFAVSRTCRSCRASAPFYNQLIHYVNRLPVATLAIAQDDEEAIHAYLRDLNLPIEQVRKVEFSAINIRVTPTLEVVDGSGKLIAAWVGQLSPEQQNEVIRVIEKQAS